MHVTQTYVSARGTGAPINIYLLWITNSEEDARERDAFSDRLRSYGQGLGGQADIFAPLGNAGDFISAELRSVYEKRWWDLENDLPAFLILDKRLKDFDPNRESGVLVPIPQGHLSPEAFRALLEKLDKIVAEIALGQRSPETWRDVFKRIYESTEIKIGLWGVQLDLKCPIPDDHIDPRRTALFMARSLLREVREGSRPC